MTPPRNRPAAPPITGYRMLSTDGGLFCFGDAAFPGAPAQRIADRRWVAACSLAEGMVIAAADDSSVVVLGGDRSEDRTVDDWAAASIVDVTPLPDGDGYWLLDAVGGVFCFGDAGYHGSVPGLELAGPPVMAAGLAATPSGRGYWIVDRAGGVYAFGDAEWFGSVPGLRLEEPTAAAIALLPSPSGDGYAVVERDGTVRGFGDARPPAVIGGGRDVVLAAAVAAPDERSIVAVDDRGLIHPGGGAPMFGSLAGVVLQAPVVDVIA